MLLRQGDVISIYIKNAHPDINTDEVSKAADGEVASTSETNIVVKHDRKPLCGGDDLFVRHERAVAPHGALGQRVQQ